MILFRPLAGLLNFKSAVIRYGCLLFLCGCGEIGEEEFRHKLVVDGWIEEGNVAYVILTQNKQLITTLDSTAANDMVIRWAKVSVSDGEKTEVLSGRIDTNYFPPFVYRGSLMLGEAGRTYTLKVEYSGRTWSAETTIPLSVPLAEITAKPVAGNDTLYRIDAFFNDPAGEKNYYKFFTQIDGRDKRYLPALMGSLNDNLFSGQGTHTTVNRGIDYTKMKKFETNFNIRDTVWVKFCTMPEYGFTFWTGVENELINGQNPLFPANQNLRSNIEGGLGLWCGYGRYVYRVFYKP